MSLCFPTKMIWIGALEKYDGRKLWKIKNQKANPYIFKFKKKLSAERNFIHKWINSQYSVHKVKFKKLFSYFNFWKYNSVSLLFLMELLINILHKYTRIQIHMYFLVFGTLVTPFMHHRWCFLGHGSFHRERDSGCRIFFFCFGRIAWLSGILVPWLGVEPESLALEAWSLNHWTTGEIPCQTFRRSS